MAGLRLYIETSVWSHYFADDAPDWLKATRIFFDRCRESQGDVLLYLSEVVLDELHASPAPKADDFGRLVEDYAPEILPIVPEAYELAQAYLANGAIPVSHSADAMHAALATVHGMDGLVSWNYRHMVSLKRRRGISAVNLTMGYNKAMDILSPPEVFEDVS